MTEPLTHKERTHARILEEAASAMRLHGADGISVAGLMKRAGLTHGGFYAHFASRDALVLDAVDRMLLDSRSLVEASLGGLTTDVKVVREILQRLEASQNRRPP